MPLWELLCGGNGAAVTPTHEPGPHGRPMLADTDDRTLSGKTAETRSARQQPASREATMREGDSPGSRLGNRPRGSRRSSSEGYSNIPGLPTLPGVDGAHDKASKGLFGMDWGWLARAKLTLGPASDGLGDGGDKSGRTSRRQSSSAAETLARRGFMVHLAKDIHKSVSTATTKPIAVLGMEPATDERSGEVALHSDISRAGGDHDASRKNHNKLFPLYINGVAKSYFKVRTTGGGSCLERVSRCHTCTHMYRATQLGCLTPSAHSRFSTRLLAHAWAESVPECPSGAQRYWWAPVLQPTALSGCAYSTRGVARQLVWLFFLQSP